MTSAVDRAVLPDWATETRKAAHKSVYLRVQMALWIDIVAGGAIWTYAQISCYECDYLNFVYFQPDWRVFGIAWVVALLPLAWMPLEKTRPSVIVYYVLYTLVYVPSCVIPPISAALETSEIFKLLLVMAVCFYLLGLIYRLPLQQFCRTRMSRTDLWIVLMVFSMATCGFVAWHFGLSFKLHSFADVYDLRVAMRDVVAYGSLTAYVLEWQSSIVCPLLFIGGVVYRRWTVAALGAGISLWMYSITGHKALLFVLPTTALVLLILRMRRRPLVWYLTFGAMLFSVICYVVDILRCSTYLRLLLIHRIFITSGHLTGIYYLYLHDKPKFWLSHSIFERFLENPYQTSPGFIVGNEYFGQSYMNACGNFWCDGYANFGFVGIVAATLLLGMVLWLYDCLTQGMDIRFATALMFIPAMRLVSAGVLTVLMTNGLALILVLVCFMPVGDMFHEQSGAIKLAVKRP